MFCVRDVRGKTVPLALAAAVAVGIVAVAVVVAGIVVAVAGFAGPVRKLRIPLSPVHININHYSGVNVEDYIGASVVLQCDIF
jgi:hypothetical protein